MKVRILALAFCASSAFWSPAKAAVTVDGYSLESKNSFGGNGNLSNKEHQGTTINATVKNDGSKVTFVSPVKLKISGDGKIAPLSGLIKALTVNFEKGWDNVTFSFDGDKGGVFDLSVNDSAAFESGIGGNCSICKIVKSGQNKFTVSGSGITKLAFNFDPGVSSARQFRVEGVSNVSAVPEPATWAMMMLGLGVIGAAMRSAKRRQRVSILYA